MLSPSLESDEPVHRPGSGVVEGSGTAADPYRVAGWCIASPPETSQVEGVAGINLDGTQAHVVVEDNRILGSELSQGVRLADAENVHLRGNAVQGHRTGVLVSQVSQVAIEANRITGTEAQATGLVVERSRSVEVANNTVTGQGQGGLRVLDSEAVVVHGNEVHGNAWAGFAGPAVDVTGGTGNLVADNAILDNGGHHTVQLKLGSNHVLRDNHIAGNADGVIVWASEDNVIRGNRIEANEGVGIGLTAGADGTRVLGNDVAGNEGPGIDAWAARSNEITDNRVVANEGDGMVVRNWTMDNLLAGNTVSDNAGDGIVVEASDGHRLRANTVQGNHRGLVLTDIEDVEIENVTVAGSTAEGILAADAGVEIAGAEVTGNGADGVRVSGGPTKIAESSLHGNAGHGLRVSDADEPVDATRNWWGHDSGPTGGAVDACTGEVADGQGASIAVEGAGVCFDPWLEDPISDPGAGG